MKLPVRYRVTPGNIDAALRTRAVLKLLQPFYRLESRILEVGSGSAGVTEFLNHPITGVDPSFERTKERQTELVTPVAGVADDLPFPDGSFDIVLSLEMLEHIPRPKRAKSLAEMVRVLAPGGMLAVSFPCDRPAERYDKKLNEQYKVRHGADHQWLIEHIEEGLPQEAEISAILREVTAPGDRIRHVNHLWLPAWYAMHQLYTVQRGYLIAKRLGLHTEAFAKLLFHVLNTLNLSPSYRKIFIVRKANA